LESKRGGSPRERVPPASRHRRLESLLSPTIMPMYRTHGATTCLAPPPDFRYVGLEIARARRVSAWLGLAGAGAAIGVACHGAAGALIGAGAAVATGALVGARGGLEYSAQGRGTLGMAIVPWGVVVELDDRSCILRWPAVVRVNVRSVHGRDQGTSITRYTVVTVDTPRERFVGRAPGTLPLERLSVHLGEYSKEASHRIALDLDGAVWGEGPSEPDVELVLSAVRGYASSSSAARRLDLLPAGYRLQGVKLASSRTIHELSTILRDRVAREIDPRPFAAVLAVELGATALVDDLLDLVQAPLPLLAAIAKVAATKLGVAKAKVGSLEELEPFLLDRDAEALAAWRAA